MKVKKLFLPLLLIGIALFSMAGCTSETEFEDMEITKIETLWNEGFAPFPRYFLRTFDFKKGKVYDTLVTDSDISEVLENTSELKVEDYNNPKQIATFTQKQAVTLYEKIKSLGFLDWEDEYITDDVINDAGSKRISVSFPDGTVKSTSIYFEYPPNYNKICNAFKECLGVNFYFTAS